MTISVDVAPPKLRQASARVSFAGARVVAALMLREMAGTSGRLAGGYLWTILQPVATIAFMSFIFSLGFKNPRLGTNFPIFHATGFLPYGMTMFLVGKMAGALSSTAKLMEYPRVTFVDALTAKLILNVLTQLIICTIVFTGIKLIFETRTTLVMHKILLSFAMVISVGAGVGTLNCFLFTMFPLWQKIWGVLTAPLLIMSGVIFLHDTVPEPYRSWLAWNPLVHIVGEMRSAFYYSYPADYVELTYVFAFSIVTLTAGLLLLHRYHRDLREL